jgi:hypothetical protein
MNAALTLPSNTEPREKSPAGHQTKTGQGIKQSTDKDILILLSKKFLYLSIILIKKSK